MSDEAFKLPGSSYEELTRIIQGYGFQNGEVSLEDVAHATQMHATQISRNNGFLISSGIIEGGKKKKTTPIGAKLAKALEHNQINEVQSAWREIIKSNEFLSKMVAAVRIRRGMDMSALQSHIAYSAGQPRNKNTVAGARAVVEILRESGLVEERDGQIISKELPVDGNTGSLSSKGQDANASLKNLETQDSVNQAVASQDSLRFDIATTSPHISVQVQIQIVTQPSEIEGLGKKIRGLIEELMNRQEELLLDQKEIKTSEPDEKDDIDIVNTEE